MTRLHQQSDREIRTRHPFGSPTRGFFTVTIYPTACGRTLDLDGIAAMPEDVTCKTCLRVMATWPTELTGDGCE
jgi:hypothetical protein